MCVLLRQVPQRTKLLDECESVIGYVIMTSKTSLYGDINVCILSGQERKTFKHCAIRLFQSRTFFSILS